MSADDLAAALGAAVCLTPDEMPAALYASRQEVIRLRADLDHARAKADNARADADALAAENVALRARAVPEGWYVEWGVCACGDPGCEYRDARLVRDPASEGADQ